MRFKIHSISDIITNSSSEVFLVSKDSEIKNIKGLQEKLNLGDVSDLLKFIHTYSWGIDKDYNYGDLCITLDHIRNITDAFSNYFNDSDWDDNISKIGILRDEMYKVFAESFKDIVAIVIDNGYHYEFIVNNPNLKYENFPY